MKRTRLIGAMLVPLLLAACGNSPQQPTDGSMAEGGSSDFDSLSDELNSTDATTTSAVPPSVAADPNTVSGRWAPSTDQCTTDAAPDVVEISSARFDGLGRTCAITRLIDAGNGAVTATLACEGDQQTDAELLKLTPADNTLSVLEIGGEENETVLQRCP